jgi:chaperonin GroEL (HSP60 family)
MIICDRLTNDGNAILREIDVAHPAAKNMIELSRTQDEECGDGTTSVIILGMRPQPVHNGQYTDAYYSW